MKRTVLIILCCLFLFSCSSKGNLIKNADAIKDIYTVDRNQAVTEDNAKKILADYTIEFTVPNPLFGKSRSGPRRYDPRHRDEIKCIATLLDDYSTKADITVKCLNDSLDAIACAEFRKKYSEELVRDGMFRIRVSMESGFSSKSMEPDHWAIYIQNVKGVMIEPAEIVASEVKNQRDSVYSDYYKVNVARNMEYRDLTLYFKRITFFGEDLFGDANPYFLLVMSQEQKTVATVAWKLSEDEGA